MGCISIYGLKSSVMGVRWVAYKSKEVGANTCNISKLLRVGRLKCTSCMCVYRKHIHDILMSTISDRFAIHEYEHRFTFIARAKVSSRRTTVLTRVCTKCNNGNYLLPLVNANCTLFQAGRHSTASFSCLYTTVAQSITG